MAKDKQSRANTAAAQLKKLSDQTSDLDRKLKADIKQYGEELKAAIDRRMAELTKEASSKVGPFATEVDAALRQATQGTTTAAEVVRQLNECAAISDDVQLLLTEHSIVDDIATADALKVPSSEMDLKVFGLSFVRTDEQLKTMSAAGYLTNPREGPPTLSGEGTEAEFKIGATRTFTVTPRYPTSAPCKVDIKGPVEVKAAVTPAAGGAWNVSYTLPKGEFTIAVSLGGAAASFTVKNKPPVVVVCERGKHCLLLFRFDGTLIRKIGGDSYGSGQCQFYNPFQAVVSLEGLIFVADSANNRVQVLRSDGSFVRFIPANNCRGVALDAAGLVYASDYTNHVIRVFKQDGTAVRTIGTPHTSTNGTDSSPVGSLQYPDGIYITQGLLYVANQYKNRVEIFNAADGKPVGKIPLGGYVYGVSASADGLVLPCLNNYEVGVWRGSGESWSSVRKLNGNGLTGAWGSCVDDDLIYIGNNSGSGAPILVFNINTGVFVRKLGEGHLNTPNGVCVAYLPDS